MVGASVGGSVAAGSGLLVSIAKAQTGSATFLSFVGPRS